jgi:hypothetical protein
MPELESAPPIIPSPDVRAHLADADESDEIDLGEPLDIEIDLGLPGEPPDDRRFCTSCRNFRAPKCMAARKIGASRNYEPCQSLPRRCKEYLPDANDIDQRPGRERWPEFAAPGWTQSADNLLLEAVLDL